MADPHIQQPRVVYVVQQAEDGSHSSTVYPTSSTPQQSQSAWSYWMKPPSQVSDLTHTDRNPRRPQSEPNSFWSRLKTNKDKEKEQNPTKRRYDDMKQAGIARWLCAVFVLGFAAGIISKGPASPLLETTAANLACACLHFFLFGPTVAPRSPTNPRPPVWYVAVLAVSSVMWAAAFSAMIPMVSNSDEYVVLDFSKRSIGKVAGAGLSTGLGTIDALKNITISCACFGAGAFFCCLLQWWYIYKLYTRPATEEEARDCYERLTKKSI